MADGTDGTNGTNGTNGTDGSRQWRVTQTSIIDDMGWAKSAPACHHPEITLIAGERWLE